LRRTPLLPALLLVFLVPLFWASCATTSTGPSSKLDDPGTEAEIQYQSGVAAMAKGNWELAYFNLLKASRLSPKVAKIHYALGTTQLYRKDFEDARKELNETLRLDQKFADAYNNLGVVALRQEKWDEAIALLEKALLQIDYQTPEKALTNIGHAYFKKKDYPKALEYLNRALAIDPELEEARRNLAGVFLAAGRLDKARDLLLKILDHDPGYAAGHLQLGIVFYKNQETAKAKEEFAAVVKLVPGSEDASTARSYLDLID
jgi:type IV pilus biogenesis/stability protein PilW